MKTPAIIATVLISLGSASGAPPESLTSEQAADGWIALFDGETMFGWTTSDERVDWTVEDGAITASSGPVGFLVSNSAFADYELHVEFRGTPTTNGGVFLHTAAQPSNPARACYEVNIAPPDNPFPTGGIVSRASRDESTAPPADDKWHAFDIRVVDGRVEVKLDGRVCCTYVDPAPLARGQIALQHNEGTIAYRNIRLKPLGTEALFNGKDLTGWNIDRAEASRFDVTDADELRVRDGRGQIESDGQYGDFVLQLDCRVDGDGLNSGVFFRCIPGDMMMGYECQISNAMKDGDPTQPVDCGTGGIFRRQNARRIVARDREWFTLTLLADGPHMAAWVDGHQVSDWTDDRAPDENPRRGQRLKAGTLAIQGHDPTTDLRFRNLNIAELPPRSVD